MKVSYTPYTRKVGTGFAISVWSKKNNYTQFTIQFGVLSMIRKQKLRTDWQKKLMKLKIMFYVQHLLGIGHVFRAMRVAKGFARAGCQTHIIWGGKKIDSMDTTSINMHYLQAVHVADEDFKALLLDDGTPMDEAEKTSRADHLLELYDKISPDIVITEAFPFGRRQMRFELVPLMEAAAKSPKKPLMVCSIRDILQENRAPKRVRESLDAIHQWYDIVMVHGDPDLIPIYETLEHSEEIANKIRYGGLVTPQPVDIDLTPSICPDVIISAGGGAVGKALMVAGVDAMAHCKNFPTNWCLTSGPDLAQSDFDYIKNRAPKGMVITRFVEDLAAVMAQAKVSVSRAGYNTVGDLLRAQCSAVLVPFAGGLETEQLRRAKMMENQQLATLLLDENLTPHTLANAIDEAALLPGKAAKFDLNGADKAAKILIDEYNNRH